MSEQLASPGDGNAFAGNVYIGDDSGGTAASWQSSPGAQYFGQNRFASVNAANVLGDDADLDEFMFENWIEGSAGDRAAINPSVS
jgi:hypothetical protein